jgi:inosine-uridine nucleoside N-ribohydrolase
VACALDPSRFQVQHGALRVVTEGMAMGQTLQSPRGPPSPAGERHGAPEQKACVAVDAAGVLADFRACFVGYG